MATQGRVYGPEEHHLLPPLDRNLARVSELAQQLQAELETEIDEADAGWWHHQVILQDLGATASRVSGLVREHKITTPIDMHFFSDVIDIINTGEYGQDRDSRPMSAKFERYNMWQAERSLRRRIASQPAEDLPQAA